METTIETKYEEAVEKAKKLGYKTGHIAGVWYAGDRVGWEYGVVSRGLNWVEYVTEYVDPGKSIDVRSFV